MTLEIPTEIERDLHMEATARGVAVELVAVERLRSSTNGAALSSMEAAVAKIRANPIHSSGPVDAVADLEELRAHENPLARALALVDERDAKAGNVTPRILGINDAATEIRLMREEQTP